MDIDTSSLNAARRNLVLISMALILFSLGDGSFVLDKDKVNLTILAGTITFGNPEILSKFVWVMFAWFLIRFWQFSDHKTDWSNYTYKMYLSKFMENIYKKEGLTRMVRPEQRLGGNYQALFDTWQFPSSSNQNYVIKKNDIFRKLRFFIYISITTELFGQYYFPYCLAIIALAMNKGPF